MPLYAVLRTARAIGTSLKERLIKPKTLLNSPPPRPETAEKLLTNEDIIYTILTFLDRRGILLLQTVNRTFYLASGSLLFRHLTVRTPEDLKKLLTSVHVADLDQVLLQTPFALFQHVRKVPSVTFGFAINPETARSWCQLMYPHIPVLNMAVLPSTRSLSPILRLSDYFDTLERLLRITHLKVPVALIDKYVRANPNSTIPDSITTFTLFFPPTNHCWKNGFRTQPTVDRVKRFTAHAKHIRFLVAWVKIRWEHCDCQRNQAKAVQIGPKRRAKLPWAYDVVDLIVRLVEGTRVKWELYMLANYFFQDSFASSQGFNAIPHVDIPRFVQEKLCKAKESCVVVFKGRKEYLGEGDQCDFAKDYMAHLSCRGDIDLVGIKGLRGSWRIA